MAKFMSIKIWNDRIEVFNLDQVTRFYIENNDVYIELTSNTGRQKYDGLNLDPQSICLRTFDSFEEADNFLRKIYEKLKVLGLTASL